METVIKNKKIKKFFHKTQCTFLVLSMVSTFCLPNLIHAQVEDGTPTQTQIPDSPITVPNITVDESGQAFGAINGFEQQAIGVDLAQTAASGLGTCAVGNAVAQVLKSGSVTVGLASAKLQSVFKVPTYDEYTAQLAAKETGSASVGGVPIAGSWDSIAWCLANTLIEYIGSSTVAWINNGFEGNPVFVDDPEKFFRDIADIEAGQLIQELGGGFLCEPFRVNIQIGLLNSYGRRSSGYTDYCTLTDIINNVDGFVEGNFKEGGWKGWFHMTQNPYNNYYGAYYYSELELNRRIWVSQNTLNIDLTWGNGFLSFKDPESGETTTPGRIIDQQINNRLFNGERRLLVADEFDEIINALINQLIKVAVSEVLG